MLTPYGLTAAGAMLLLLLLTGLSCRRKGIPYRTFITFGALSLLLAFLLSRLTFALSNIPLYVNTLSNPLLMLHFWDGGASLLGALLGVLLAGWLTGRIRRESVGRLMDAIAFGAPLAIAVERIGEGCFDEIMGMGKGIETEWLAFLGNLTGGNHPVFLYEAAAMVVLFVVVLLAKRKKHPEGDTMALFLLLYGCVQVVLESLRNDSHMLLIHFVRVNQVGALVLAVAVIIRWSVTAVRGKTCTGKKAGLLWALIIISIGLGIGMEFAVDRLGEPLLSYGMMALALVLIAWCGLASAGWQTRSERKDSAMEKHKIDRINELARKKKSDGLTDEEAAEHAALRQEYIAGFRENMRQVLENTYVQRPDGTKTKLQKKTPTK